MDGRRAAPASDFAPTGVDLVLAPYSSRLGGVFYLRGRGEQELRPAHWLVGWFPLDLERAGSRLLCITGQDKALGQDQGHDLMVTDVRTGHVQILKAADPGQIFAAATFSPDGISVAVVELRVKLMVRVFDLSTGVMRTLAWSPGHNSSDEDVSMAWSPDGQRIAVSYVGTTDDLPYEDGDEGASTLVVLDAITGEVINRLENTYLLGGNVWTPTGVLMVDSDLPEDEDLGPGVRREDHPGPPSGHTHARAPYTRIPNDGINTLYWMNADGSTGDPIISWSYPGGSDVLTALD